MYSHFVTARKYEDKEEFKAPGERAPFSFEQNPLNSRFVSFGAFWCTKMKFFCTKKHSSFNCIVYDTAIDSVIYIGDYAFGSCDNLKSVTIPKNVIRIDGAPFYGYRLTEINVDTDNKCFASLDGVLFNKEMTKLIKYPVGNARKNYKIPDGVTEIGSSAFWDAYVRSLTSLTIPKSVTKIGDGIFEDYSCPADVYYAGSEEDWANIDITNNFGGNDPLLNATIHYNSTGPAEPEIKTPEVTANEETGKLDVTVETENVPDTAVLVAVSYGSDGEYMDKAEVGDGAAALPAEGVKTVKIFAWESLESMRPLCPAKEVAVR